MPIQIVRNDITQMRVDAIVTSGNRHMTGGSGVNGAIHRAAGPKLAQAAQLLGACGVGEARITPAFDLPAKYVIHTVTPVWQGGMQGERQLLAACYRNALDAAWQKGCRSIAFPLMATGAHGYPRAQALQTAMDAIGTFLLESVPDNDLMVYIVVFNRESVEVSEKLLGGIRQLIDDRYADQYADRRLSARYAQAVRECAAAAPVMMESMADFRSLDELLRKKDESFSQMLTRRIAEKGMKNSECYKKANIDKKLFSKIHKDVHYKPKKQTALAFAVALEMSIDETRELLAKAGLALSPCDTFDIIVEYCINHGEYDIFVINEVLFRYNQPLLGAVIA